MDDSLVVRPADGARNLESLMLSDNRGIPDLSGLPESLLELDLERNAGLSNLDGIERAAGLRRLRVFGDSDLERLGATTTTRLDSLELGQLRRLASLDGLESVQSLGAASLSRLGALESVAGLSNVEVIEDSLTVSEVPQLRTLGEMPRLRVAGSLSLLDVHELQTLGEFPALSRVGEISLQRVPQLRSVGHVQGAVSRFWAHDTALASLEGLSSAQVEQLRLSDTDQLISLAGLNVSALREVLLQALPLLAGLGPLGEVEELDRLELVRVPVTNLDELANLRVLRRLYLEETELERIDAIDDVEGLLTLHVLDNDRLLRPPAFPRAQAERFSLEVSNNRSLVEGPALGGLVDAERVTFHGNDRLERVELTNLQRVTTLFLVDNPSLTSVDLGSLTEADAVSVQGNDALTDEVVTRLMATGSRPF